MSDAVNLPRLISDVIAEVQPGADSRGVLVRTADLASLPARAHVDEAWLRGTLHHALDLAVHALPSGVVEVALTPSEREHVWQMTLSGTRADAIEPDVRAVITLALRPEADHPAIVPLRVMVIDDSALQRSLIRTFMDGTPHSVIDVDGGVAALEYLHSHDAPFDVVVVDLQMPGMDGLTTIEAIRDFEAASHRRRATIIALTSVGASDDVADAADAGADECLAKPLSEAAFMAAIQISRPPAPSTPPAPPAPPAPSTPPTSPAVLFVLAQHQVSSALSGPASTRLARLRAGGVALSEAAAAGGFTDVAMLAGMLTQTCDTGTLREAEIAARTLQAWLARVGVDTPS
ncbi:MAG: response regulator [Vicinamibacterales bacterium]